MTNLFLRRVKLSSVVYSDSCFTVYMSDTFKKRFYFLFFNSFNRKKHIRSLLRRRLKHWLQANDKYEKAVFFSFDFLKRCKKKYSVIVYLELDTQLNLLILHAFAVYFAIIYRMCVCDFNV